MRTQVILKSHISEYNCITYLLLLWTLQVNVDEILARLVSWLPILSDEEEAVHVYSYFCDLLDK